MGLLYAFKAMDNTTEQPSRFGRLATALAQQQAEKDRSGSVMAKPAETWRPDYERVGGHALEAPMVSPDDLIGTGIPSRIAGLLGAAAKGVAAKGGLLGAIPMAGMLKPGRYPSHGWNIKGDSLKDAMSDTKKFIPDGIPENHQNDVLQLIEEIKNKGLLPYTDVDQGGSVYISAFVPVNKKNGELNLSKKPEQFGREFRSGYYSGKEKYQVRMADHGQFYSGPTLSVDPHSGNDVSTAKNMLEYFLGNIEKRPVTGSSYIIPQTGEQGGFK